MSMSGICKQLDEIDEKIAKIQRQLLKCQRERDSLYKEKFDCCNADDSYVKYDFKSNRIVECCRHKNCGKDSPKNEFKYIITENYVVNQFYTDAGYGDGDCFQWQHEFRQYKVCPKCGGIEYVDSAITNTLGEWSRMGWDQKEVDALEKKIKPKDWAGVRVIFVGTKNGCNKKFNSIKNSFCGKYYK